MVNKHFWNTSKTLYIRAMVFWVDHDMRHENLNSCQTVYE